MFRHTLFFWVLFISAVQAQQFSTIEGAFSNYYGRSFRVEIPYVGTGISIKESIVAVEEKKGKYRFDSKIDMLSDGITGFFHYGTSTYLRFWIINNGVNGLEIDWTAPLEKSDFYGDSKEENQLLFKLDLSRRTLLQSNKTFSEEQVADFKSSEQALLREQASVSLSFRDYMQKDIQYYWLYFSKKKGINAKIDALSDVDALQTKSYLQFLYEYFSDPNISLKAKYQEVRSVLKNEKVRNFYWAYDLYQESMKEKVDYSLIEEYRVFNQFNKDPLLSSFAYKHIALIEDEYRVKNTEVTNEMVIREEPMSFQAMIDQFKGKVIYLDMWATWCGPCIEEMRPRYKDPLTEFIKDKDIKIVYFSVDRDESAEQWKKMVKSLKLNSFNIRLPYYKQTEAFEFLKMSDSERYYIPRYYIIDKNGVLVNEKAPRPSEGEKLYAELAKYL